MKRITLAYVFFLSLMMAGLIISVLGATSFTKSTNTYYGRQSEISKLVVTVIPTPNDVNTISSTATSTDEIWGDLKRVTIAAAGTDIDFTVQVKDSDSITLFEKTDCNTVLLPLSYAIYQDDTEGNPHYGILSASALTVDTNDVDPNNLTSITVTLYYLEPRY